jgi:hypothetical protein
LFASAPLNLNSAAAPVGVPAQCMAAVVLARKESSQPCFYLERIPGETQAKTLRYAKEFRVVGALSFKLEGSGRTISASVTICINEKKRKNWKKAVGLFRFRRRCKLRCKLGCRTSPDKHE